jgi:hypothetical protein
MEDEYDEEDEYKDDDWPPLYGCRATFIWLHTYCFSSLSHGLTMEVIPGHPARSAFAGCMTLKDYWKYKFP